MGTSLICWRRKWQPTPAFLPGESHGQRSLAGCSPRGRKESDTTEATLQANMHWRRKWPPTPVFLPGEFNGQWSLAGCSPRGRKESDTTEQFSQFSSTGIHMSFRQGGIQVLITSVFNSWPLGHPFFHDNFIFKFTFTSGPLKFPDLYLEVSHYDQSSYL